MLPSVRLACLLVAALGLAILPPTALADVAVSVGPASIGLVSGGLQQAPNVITARLGISPGDANQGLALGADRRVLERALPELFETATALGIRIETVSVGRGFFAGDDGVESETDLDLVVTGVRENVLALGATLGQRWGQSVVLVWEARGSGETPTPSGEMLTAAGALPGGADRITDATFSALIKEFPDGGHIRYAGPESLLFVANTGEVSDLEFRERLGRAQRILETGGVRTGSLTTAHAVMVELNRDNYQQYIDAAIRGKAA
jgi:hypothetical protein